MCWASTPRGKPERTRQCFDAFKELHHRVLDSVDSVPAKGGAVFSGRVAAGQGGGVRRGGGTVWRR